MTDTTNWKVGELAKKTGLTVRTLHHYEELKLLIPSHRSPAGYRLYSTSDLRKLQIILSLKQMGFPLEQIKESMGNPQFSLESVIAMQIGKLREHLALEEDLLERLDGLLRLSKARKHEITMEELTQVMELMHRVECYYTPEMLETFKTRRKELGRDAIVAAENDWQTLIADVQKEMDAGTKPTHPRVRKLAKTWMALVQSFTQGNPEVEARMKKMYEENPDMSTQFGGPGKEMQEYIGKAMKGMSP